MPAIKRGAQGKDSREAAAGKRGHPLHSNHKGGCGSESNLQNLIPIAVAIASGCEPCTRTAVARALTQGSSPQQIDETLHIIAFMRTLDCLLGAVGAEVIARMEKPLSAAARMLQEQRGFRRQVP